MRCPVSKRARWSRVRDFGMRPGIPFRRESAMPHRFRSLLAAALTFAACTLPAWAAPAPAPLPASLLPALHWRLLGPFRGGWATMAAGIPDQPEVYYIGTAGGGQPEPRYDIAAGDGMYRSADGGRHWQHAGLAGTRHIGAIWVDPRHPDTVVVAALGHVFGPSAERGLYRSTDGGRHWQHVLFVDARTGGVDLAADPKDPHTLYASLWSIRNYPWLSYVTPIVRSGGGLFVSHDDGVRWQKLGGTGWPTAPLGRIGLAVTDTAAGTRIYAAIDGGGAVAATGLWRSDDGGDHWLRVNADAPVTNWYASRMTV